RPQPLTDRGFADSIAADNDIDVSEGDSLIGLKNRCIDDMEAFDPAKWMHHGAVLARDFELVRGLPAQKDGRWIILAVVCLAQSQMPFATLRSSSGERLPRHRGPRFAAAKI